ncbi:KR domain-containing protein [Phaeosphaeriaceae sp. PMI808]|nr:KR domain-containing protein [Phaeosphaeriaceae sp. PMI808]
MPPFKGLIQCAMVLHDATFENQSLETWHSAIAPKFQGSWNLYLILPRNMDFFIMLSSQSGICGQHGQSNYAAGNTYQDILALHLSSHGMNAVSINLGVIENIGFVAENERIRESMRARLCFCEMSEDQLLRLIGHYCDPTSYDNNGSSSQIISTLPLPADLRRRGITEPDFLGRPLFSHLHGIHTETLSTLKPSGGAQTFENSLREASSIEEANDIIVEGIQLQLAKLLVVDKETIDPEKPIHAHGVDSLIATEMRNWFRRGIGADVSVFEILENIPITVLARRVTQTSTFISTVTASS